MREVALSKAFRTAILPDDPESDTLSASALARLPTEDRS
jgi:hypothetical protein